MSGLPIIFISYSRRHRATALLVHRLLKQYLGDEYEITWDYDLTPPKNWRNQLDEWIIHCDYFIFLLTTDARESFYCLHEYNLACENKRVIIPVIMDSMVVKAFPQEIKSQAIHLYNDDEYTEDDFNPSNLGDCTSGWCQLIRALTDEIELDVGNRPQNEKLDLLVDVSIDKAINTIRDSLQEIYLFAFSPILLPNNRLTPSLLEKLRKELATKFHQIFSDTEFQSALLAYKLINNNIVTSVEQHRQDLGNHIHKFIEFNSDQKEIVKQHYIKAQIEGRGEIYSKLNLTINSADKDFLEAIRLCAKKDLQGALENLSQLLW